MLGWEKCGKNRWEGVRPRCGPVMRDCSQPVGQGRSEKSGINPTNRSRPRHRGPIGRSVPVFSTPPPQNHLRERGSAIVWALFCVIITTGIVLDPHKLILMGVLAGAVGVAAMPLVWLGQAAAGRRNRIHRKSVLKLADGLGRRKKETNFLKFRRPHVVRNRQTDDRVLLALIHL